MNPLKLFGFAGSTYVRTARLVCEEKGVPHELMPLEFRAESHRARHPFLKMPALTHDGVELFETLAIATYVDGLAASPQLQPSSPRDRALMMQWISAAIDYVYDDLVRALLSDSQESGARGRVAGALDALEAGLGSREFFASTLSLADFFLAPMVDFAARKEPDFVRGPRRALERWLGSMQARPSMRATAA